MSISSSRRPSALHLQETGSTTSGAQEEMSGHLSDTPLPKKRLPFVQAPSTPMFYSHSQGSDADTSNPYEDSISAPQSLPSRVFAHDAQRPSISGTAGLREKGLGDNHWDQEEEEYEETYAPNGRKPSRLRGSLSSTNQPLLGTVNGFVLDESDMPKNLLSRLSRSLLCRRLPLAAVVPALLLGAIFMGLYDSHSPSSVMSTTYPSTQLGYSTQEPDLANSLDFHLNGHVYLKESALHTGLASHPILQLVQNATQQWETKISSQSKSLSDAVREYRRRYKRAPPKGFDHWYAFATKNNVGLVDEYDSIHHSILPFLSLPRNILLARQEGLKESPDTHTVQVRKGKVTLYGARKELRRAKEQSEMLQHFVEWIPDVDIVMSAHDGPSVIMADALKSLHTSKAERGQTLTSEEAETVDDDAAVWGWALACPAHSRLRRAQLGLEIGALYPGPSFVAEHQATMELCKNPEWQYLHGFTSWHGARPSVLMPLFSFARSTLHSDLLCVPLEQYWDVPPEAEDPEWEDKKNNKLVWRGSTTGVWFERDTWWRSSQRMRLVAMANDKDLDGAWGRKVRFTAKDEAGEESIVERTMDPELLEQRYMDVGFAGKMGQCTVEDGSCEAIPKYLKFVESLSWPAQDQYKYIIDVDGNAWSGRFHRLLVSNALVLKSTIFPEWYAERIQPWVHYVPVKVDYSDLYDIMAFFSGDLDGNNGHDDLAKQIAYGGKAWAGEYWRYVDMQACLSFFSSSWDWSWLTETQ